MPEKDFDSLLSDASYAASATNSAGAAPQNATVHAETSVQSMVTNRTGPTAETGSSD